MVKQSAVALTAMAAALLLPGCSQSPKPTIQDRPAAVAVPAASPELVTGKTAFWSMYKSAHSWNADVVMLGLTAREMPGFKNTAGKAAMWQASFASPSMHQYRVDSDAIAAAPPDIYKGAVDGLRQSWSGVTRDAMPIDISSVNVDSDAAYQTAAVDAAPWLKKNPEKKLSSFQLGNAYKFNAPVWYMRWGDRKSGYVALVNATTGKVLKN